MFAQTRFSKYEGCFEIVLIGIISLGLATSFLITLTCPVHFKMYAGRMYGFLSSIFCSRLKPDSDNGMSWSETTQRHVHGETFPVFPGNQNEFVHLEKSRSEILCCYSLLNKECSVMSPYQKLTSVPSQSGDWGVWDLI